MIALFDLDGTILPWDTQKLFCHYVITRHPLRRLFLLAYVPLTPFASTLGSEGLKRVFLSFLWKMERHEIEEYARAFAAEWVAKSAWPEMLARINQHKKNGDLTVLVSASPEAYVREIGKILGFDLSYGTVIDFPDKGGLPIFPDLINNKGHNKVLRLREELDQSHFANDGTLQQAHGYTDSRADLPMLSLCQTATVVNPSKKLLAIAEDKGWEIIRLPRPWKNKIHRFLLRIKIVLGF
ncbi:MAG TPA: hypothetical protein DDW21_09010 [Verrucomicrobiales bacterium]|nr:MAG: hypothetical protein B9S37_01765 [Verrucomicrobiae bacterium Tous-C3TDCM]PAZ06503.1 MAG: hypothetical protein CAK88_03150 [Verrucomicrobiae bacterium AMD-G2]HBE23554.1 hypothetical protein [Verrucomicrobiales bacterium]